MNKSFFLIRLLVSPLALLLIVCGLPAGHALAGSVSHPSHHERAIIAAGKGLRHWYWDIELKRRPNLRVTPDQVVVLHLRPTPKDGRLRRHMLNYHFPETGRYNFCLPKQDPHLRSLTLLRNGIQPVVHLERGEACKSREVTAGFYRLQIMQDGKGIGPDGKKAFVHVPRIKAAPLLGEAQNVQVALTTTTVSSLPICDPNTPYNNARLQLKVANNFIAENNAFKLTTQSTPANDGGWNICPDGSGNYLIFQPGGPYAFNSAGPSSTDKSLHVDWPATPFKLTELGNNQFTLAANFSGKLYPVVLGADNTLQWTSAGTNPSVFSISLKYYESDVQAQDLQVGEVALFQGCNYDSTISGTWVFTTEVPDFGQFKILPLDNNVASVKPGPETIASLYADANFAGTRQLISEDTPCLSTTPLGVNTASSLQISPARQFVAATDECQNCNLTGIDLSDLDLSGGQFQGTTFTNADLTSTILQGASLNNANLNGAATILTGTNFVSSLLRCTNFSGADLSQAIVTFSGIKPIVTTDFSCRLDLAGASFNLSAFPISQWRYFDLTGAKINNINQAVLSSSSSPLDLSGAILNHAAFPQVVLDKANLGCATTSKGPVCTQMNEISLDWASLKQANLVNALLQGAHLDFANLDGANLCAAKLNQTPDTQLSATLQGAFLRNVNLAQADLTGALLLNANFYSSSAIYPCNPSSCGFTASCASAANSRLNGTDLSGAYLSGVDFSGSSPQSTNFSNTYLVGSHFNTANLSQDIGTGSRTDFSRSWLQGVDFENARATGAIFTSAVVDLESDSGLRLYMQLDPTTHINYGNWVTPYTNSTGSILGCAKFTTQVSSDVPFTDSTNLCPDGSVGPCSLSQWQAPTSPILPSSSCNESTHDKNW